jgi:hypothetical protein
MNKKTREAFERLTGDKVAAPARAPKEAKTPEEIEALRAELDAATADWPDEPEEQDEQGVADEIEGGVIAPSGEAVEMKLKPSIISGSLGDSSPEVTDHTQAWVPEIEGVTKEDVEAAEELAEGVMGTKIGQQLVGWELIRMGLDDTTHAVLNILETFGADVTDLTLGGRKYTLATISDLTRDQLKGVWGIVAKVQKLRAEYFDADTKNFDLMKLLQALIDTDLDLELFSYLYVPEGQDYDDDPEVIAQVRKDMGKLKTGQQLGALYRFFSPVWSWLPGAIRNWLAKAVTLGLQKLA